MRNTVRCQPLYKTFVASAASLLLAIGAAEARPVAGTVRSAIGGGSTYCLDVPRGDFRPGVLIQSYPCHGGANQQFVYDADTGLLQIGGLCVDAYVGSSGRPSQPGDRVGLWTCHGQQNQQWKIRQCLGQYCLLNVHPYMLTSGGQCLDIANGRVGAGSQLLLWNCQDSENQRFNMPGY
ncbi:ricin-type beta-trefoil lectin domain protein [Mangrovibrevibacter kandeliae]|uniref:ricin-type beta-trefoil lectin domain protein n=1 Tax=Mangrovibrevibacter kandeliae TaxID=2968473 RepID=UPI002119385E|nr:ricin-type beta-trefoil lectin domain protein [Aurantimonas sp. CSK15Z-1]MCQ8782695.1 ricin-type beta-trefoil lectin domain protein [Aurantimonas sp. CSK15Z-1]